MAAPATTSEWPPTYLVREYTDKSAPCSSGRWNTGPSKVLSQISSGLSPFCCWASSWAMWANKAMSTMVLVGLDGVST